MQSDHMSISPKWGLTTTVAVAAVVEKELPHEFLCRVARGEGVEQWVPVRRPGPGPQAYELVTVYATFKQRLAAAREAAPYFAPKLGRILQDASKTKHERDFEALMAELAQQLPT